nr:MAG TPA: hypothetical protein [Caudoviricetes sp.]
MRPLHKPPKTAKIGKISEKLKNTHRKIAKRHTEKAKSEKWQKRRNVLYIYIKLLNY